MTLAANVVHFVRLLRRAGMTVGPGDALDAERAVAAVDILRKEQFYAALHATLVRRRSDHELFDEAFRLFWRDPMGATSALALLLPQVRTPTQRSISRRLSEAWRPPAATEPPAAPQQPPRVDTFLAYSADEVLRTRDFDQMSADELRRARVLVRTLALPIPAVRTRRWRPDHAGGRIDRARTIRAALRRGGQLVELPRRALVTRPPKLVALCDISGSMGRYSEMVLRFLHTLLARHTDNAVFLFATRLSNVTRTLRKYEIDVALARCGTEVTDWSGGTLLGASLREFNRTWSRRVLGGDAVVLLVTDGLERGDPALLEAEAARLRRSCRRLIWLNPL
ncbi:MAG TPA: VWA domain-containing protein, partial [Kofleriaceae bacterium]|nr:VWA domain-containing protein [Kofleriaceae bacterium]